MAAFTALRDICREVEEQLRRDATELFSVKQTENFEDGIAKKTRRLALFTAKLRLVQAKISGPKQHELPVIDEDRIIHSYSNTVTWKIAEQQVAKAAQLHAVRELLQSKDQSLDMELLERKQNIKEELMQFRHKDSELRRLDCLLKEKEDELAAVQLEFLKEINLLRTMKTSADETVEFDSSGPYYRKLSGVVVKLEIMRWLISKLLTGRSRSYDWLSDPARKLKLLKLTREVNDIERFTG